ncbi:hypothetical protein [Dactylosporangium sp. NPDC048998]|uniref:hypothetical protein n=1 Tax=Dactylosporangium sp. NPDC048998 TaxID=3363976 RepID=UPI00371BABCE
MSYEHRSHTRTHPNTASTTNHTTMADVRCIGAVTRQARIAAETRDFAVHAADLATDLLPAGWTAHAAPAGRGSVYLLVLTPPAGTAVAQLLAPHAGHGWAISVTDPVAGTDTVLRTGTGDVAYQATLAGAVRAALDALDAVAPAAHRSGRQLPAAARYVDSDCLIGLTDPRRPDLVRARTVERGGHPHVMLPTLRRIWTRTGHDSTRLAARLLAHDWHCLDPATTPPTAATVPATGGPHTTGGGGAVTRRRVVAGIGITRTPTDPDGTVLGPEPAAVVPLAHLGNLDAAWLYLLDPLADTVTVHTGDGDVISRHPLRP